MPCVRHRSRTAWPQTDRRNRPGSTRSNRCGTARLSSRTGRGGSQELTPWPSSWLQRSIWCPRAATATLLPDQT
eukprot:5278507-Alexandrium_andersonii.AAC.1